MLQSSGASALGRAVTASLTLIWHCSALTGGFLSGGLFERNVQSRNHQVLEEVALKATRECQLSLLDTEPSKKDNKKHKKSKEGSDGTHWGGWIVFSVVLNWLVLAVSGLCWRCCCRHRGRPEEDREIEPSIEDKQTLARQQLASIRLRQHGTL